MLQAGLGSCFSLFLFPVPRSLVVTKYLFAPGTGAWEKMVDPWEPEAAAWETGRTRAELVSRQAFGAGLSMEQLSAPLMTSEGGPGQGGWYWRGARQGGGAVTGAVGGVAGAGAGPGGRKGLGAGKKGFREEELEKGGGGIIWHPSAMCSPPSWCLEPFCDVK